MCLLICAATGRELAALAPALFPEADALEEMRLIPMRLKGREALATSNGFLCLKRGGHSPLCWNLRQFIKTRRCS